VEKYIEIFAISSIPRLRLILQMIEPHQRIKPASPREEDRFQAVVQPTEAERAFFGRSVCQGDPAMRQRLEALLASDEQPDTQLEPPANRRDELHESSSSGMGLTELGPPGAAARPTPKLARAEAPDEAMRRRVALKGINPGMDTKRVVARFG
jgi:eukaryotic-like serine/threonine-protein kinase